MAGTGQEEWNHICDLCCYIYRDDDGQWVYLRSNVTDGLTMGHFCCTVHDCQNRLRSVKDSFCPEHQPLKKQCCVTACTATAEVGFRTCSITEHRDAELYHYQRGKAMFQLKDRLQRAKGSTPADSFPPPRDDSSPTSSRLSGSQFETTALGTDLLPVAFDIESPWETTMSRPNGSYTAAVDSDDDGETEYVCEGKSPNGNKVIKAFFGRKSTHNEQLSIYSCGVGAGRASFFGSEAPNAVREFWMKLYPTKASLPGVLWHDNNCSIVKMLRNDPDEYHRDYFEDIALPVDVFHFKCKHKETDLDCGTNCNPYRWPELRTEDGKWRFNSSAAEQTNAWFGGFQSIVREMTVERYNFFLDEMIKRRNRTLVQDLRRRGKHPNNLPRAMLLDGYEADAMELSADDYATLVSEGMVGVGEQLPEPYEYDDMPALI
ncbi:hypothetical protein B0H16DRAFT_1836555 [Mycena metata]|uniref:CxC6 like cysteine cluster associated with KDZ domain-containing protein n=1 Tax=Mycena metata TaxID=1033252 RepID=A0AAD7GKK0_9AGAR|nr:hypothetical protein B0H16DRAFT_1836555 [Mycena metata]